jgi:hypothetical protein
MDITDDETFGSNEHGSRVDHQEAIVGSTNPSSLNKVVGVAGGEGWLK